MRYDLQFFGGRGASGGGPDSSGGAGGGNATGGGGNMAQVEDMMHGGNVVDSHVYDSSVTKQDLHDLADTARFSTSENYFGEKEEYIFATINTGGRPVQIETSITHNSDGTFDVLSTTTRGSYAGTIKTYKKYETAVNNARNAFKKNVDAISW